MEQFLRHLIRQSSFGVGSLRHGYENSHIEGLSTWLFSLQRESWPICVRMQAKLRVDSLQRSEDVLSRRLHPSGCRLIV